MVVGVHKARREFVASILRKLFGIDPKRVDLSDDLSDDWGIDKMERERFEKVFANAISKPSATFADCRTVEDFARLIG